ncbi:MAG TPA: chromate transporter, partial [Cytophagales bacterium]|nr:chromate transporter [Cytophagales bacterium]
MENKPNYSLKDLVFYFLKLGASGFGGPVALVGYMYRDLVENKQWISDDDYKEGLALSQLAPGPLAAQLSIYLGYVHYRILGATLAGLAFVFPSFLMVLAIGWAYVTFDGLPLMQSIFYGVGAAVIGIISIGSYKLTSKSIGKDYWLWAIFLVLAVFTFITEEENMWLIIGGGVLIWLMKSPPKWNFGSLKTIALPVLLQIPTQDSTNAKLWQIAWFFTKAGA